MILDDQINVPIHAPTSGQIEEISFYTDPLDPHKKNIKIVILSDYLDQWIRLQPIKNYKKYNSKELIQIIHKSGIVGLGGGQFSSAKKLMLSVNKVHTLIVNAVESEPYITSDNCLINNYIDEILKGCEIISWISNIKKVLIAIQEDKIEAISKIYKYIENRLSFKICIIKNKYPGGSSKVLIKSLTGKEIPHGKHSIDIGYLVFNVATIYAIKRAILNGEPLTERIITILGSKHFLSGNFWTRIGTPIKYFLNNQKYKIPLDTTVYLGGPFMGKKVNDLNYSILKNTNCISIQFKKKQNKSIIEQGCIRCGYCSTVCPVNLLPQQLYLYSKNGHHEKSKRYDILDCIECKACEKVCPSSIPLVNYFKMEKNIIKNIELENHLKKISFFRFKKREARLLNTQRFVNKFNKNSIERIISKYEKSDDIKKNIRKKQVQDAIERMKNKK
ncbi:Rnfc [Buchnera aphidicola str. G002 (Myzus persicae)]|uniref:Ion-translocating oxidoreductase complex subunit C n=1 Tax=Buchnera aphidicola str. USDA (Myzus persicae) TaxID=1009856 RepID=W0P4G7_BUCMP|nr:Rnfc [Buchnera aphidicola str. USDA (Myzus persicae)]AHG60833.1 Rnfc [Buchnera aphidicola str. W106 (Myzus persicae)]AHG61405.1 Rnfc [Buchnera aphidicola str. G002 (Myzus persicae)]AHG61978.1 Rnfc [Buchnera aphidicola str. F009 (Myzus persicae)]